jgi:hypothetical protein
MKNFKNYLEQCDDFSRLYDEYFNLINHSDLISEMAITLGGQRDPKFGQVVIMAGGAGSGKGFVKDKMVAMNGFNFDVDELKGLAIRASKRTDSKLGRRVKDEFGVELSKLNLKTPSDVSTLHQIIGDDMNITSKKLKALYTSILSAHPDRKPNLMFDVTLKDLRKLDNITRSVRDIGYSPENIHIVWIVQDIEVAKNLNQTRNRVVPTDILVNTHRGASQTMQDIVNMGNDLKKYMDGDIVFAFNKVGIDSDVAVSGKGGMYVKDAKYVFVKKKGKPVMGVKQLDADLKRKIASYVPTGINWD